MSSVEGALSSVRPSSQEIHMIQVIDIEYIMWTDLCVCILTGFNEPLCSWFTYSSTMFYTWPQDASGFQVQTRLLSWGHHVGLSECDLII